MSLTEETQNQKKSTPPVPEEAVRAVPQEEWEAVAEALLFSAGDSIALVHIAKTLGVDQQTAQQVVEGLAAKYDEQKKGDSDRPRGSRVSDDQPAGVLSVYRPDV